MFDEDNSVTVILLTETPLDSFVGEDSAGEPLGSRASSSSSGSDPLNQSQKTRFLNTPEALAYHSFMRSIPLVVAKSTAIPLASIMTTVQPIITPGPPNTQARVEAAAPRNLA